MSEFATQDPTLAGPMPFSHWDATVTLLKVALSLRRQDSRMLGWRRLRAQPTIDSHVDGETGYPVGGATGLLFAIATRAANVPFVSPTQNAKSAH